MYARRVIYIHVTAGIKIHIYIHLSLTRLSGNTAGEAHSPGVDARYYD